MNRADWKCPVCGYYAQDSDEQKEHMEATGHVGQGTTGDAGVENNLGTSPNRDMSYTDQEGYAPGASNQVDSTPPDQRESSALEKGD